VAGRGRGQILDQSFTSMEALRKTAKMQ